MKRAIFNGGHNSSGVLQLGMKGEAKLGPDTPTPPYTTGNFLLSEG